MPRRPIYATAAKLAAASVLFLITTEAGLQIASIVHRRHAGRIHSSLRQDARRQLRVLCLGESTTDCQYPVQLAQLLKEKLPGHPTRVIDKGLAGTDTAHIAKKIRRLHAKHSPHIAILMMGINDFDPDEDSYVKLYAGVRPGLELKLVRSFKTYAAARYLLWHFFSPKTPAAAEPIPAPNPMPRKYPEYRLGPKLSFFYRGRHNIERPRTKDRLRRIRGLDLGRDEDAMGFLREFLSTGDIAAEVFFGAVGKFSRDYIYAEGEIARERIEITARTLGALPPTKTRLRFEIIFYSFVAMTPERMCDAPEKLLAVNPRDPYARCSAREPDFDFANADITHPFDFILFAMHLLERGDCDGMLELYRAAVRLYPHLRWELAPEVSRALMMANRHKAARALYPFLPPEAATVHHAGIHSLRVPKTTVRNYNATVDFLLAQRVTVICMQYPMRPLAALVSIIKKAGQVVFVDNNESFRKAVARHGKDRVFWDMFAGDFGHCTETGNRILAQNAARAVCGIVKRDASGPIMLSSKR